MILVALAATAALATSPPAIQKDPPISARLLPDAGQPDRGRDKVGGGRPASDIQWYAPRVASPPTVQIVPRGAVKDWTLPPQAERTPNLFNPPARCRDAAVKAVDKNGRPRPRKLTDLPPGALQLAVDRRIDGCPVLTIVRGDVVPDPQGPTIMRLEPLAPAR